MITPFQCQNSDYINSIIQCFNQPKASYRRFPDKQYKFNERGPWNIIKQIDSIKLQRESIEKYSEQSDDNKKFYHIHSG